MPQDEELRARIEATLSGEAARRWAELAPSHQREWLRYVGEAKKPETRERRIRKLAEALSS